MISRVSNMVLLAANNKMAKPIKLKRKTEIIKIDLMFALT